MTPTEEKRAALRLIEGLESGKISTGDATILAADLDPVLVYVIVAFLRQVYPASDPAASSVLERVVKMSSDETVRRKYRAGEKDPISGWLESEHGYAGFRGRAADLIGIVADKLDS